MACLRRMRSSLGLHANPKQSPDGIVEIMSNLDPDPEEVDPSAVPGARHAVNILEARKAAIGGERSPAVVHTPLAGLEAALSAAGNVTLATRPDFEYGPMAADTPASITVRNYESSDTYGNFGVNDASAVGRAGGTQFSPGISPGMLAHVPAGSDKIELPAPGPCGFMVADWLPLGEHLVMWSNFVARCAVGNCVGEGVVDGRRRPVGAGLRLRRRPRPAPPLPPWTRKPW
jgi:quercetin 2,3-dioxygenase